MSSYDYFDQTVSEAWYAEYQGWTGVSTGLWDLSTDAYLQGDSYEAYLYNAASIDAGMVADTSWDQWNASYDTSYYGAADTSWSAAATDTSWSAAATDTSWSAAATDTSWSAASTDTSWSAASE